ncbi:major facilitator superfamily domain-containing protein 12, partial [Trichonephila clavata]
MEQPPRLPWCQRICYSVGHSLNDFCASMWFSYLIVYLQLVLGFDSNYAGLVLLVGQVADAIATPLLGYEASNNKETGICKRYGKRKFLHLIGTICVVLSFPFIFSVCPGCESASQLALTTMLIPLVIIFQIGWAAVQVSHLSLIPAITPHENERDFLNVLRYAVNIVSDIGTYVVVWCVFDLTRKPIGDHHTITGDYANKFM